MDPRTVWRLNFAGWVLFTLSAAFFIWSSVRAGDPIAAVASALFLVACFVFLVPVWALRRVAEPAPGPVAHPPGGAPGPLGASDEAPPAPSSSSSA